MVKLTEYEQRMRDGEFGEFKQVAIQKIIEYAESLGAEELCEVSKATLYFGAHPYLESLGSEDYNEIFSKMYLCADKTIPMGEMEKGCFCQTCVAPCDQYVYEPLHLDRELFEKNREYLEITKKAGVSITGSCTPYLIGWIPLKGEHFVTTESSNVVMCNSVFGACGNSDGIEAAAWSAVCGRTPLWGNHTREARLGTVVFEIECPSETEIDWDIIGYTVGRKLPPHGVPVIDGAFKKPNLIKLKQCFAAMATTSGAEMCHIVDFTPEAPTREAVKRTRRSLKLPRRITMNRWQCCVIRVKTLWTLLRWGVPTIPLKKFGMPRFTLKEKNLRKMWNLPSGPITLPERWLCRTATARWLRMPAAIF